MLHYHVVTQAHPRHGLDFIPHVDKALDAGLGKLNFGTYY